MCAWHPYHTTSYHLQRDLFSRVIPQDKEDLWAQDGLFPPTQGRSEVFTMKKVYYITEDISPFFHHLWLSKLGHAALLLTCNLTIHVNNPTEFALTDYWKWKTPGNKTKSWDTFCKWTLNKTLYTVRLSTSNCLGFCIKYYHYINDSGVWVQVRFSSIVSKTVSKYLYGFTTWIQSPPNTTNATSKYVSLVTLVFNLRKLASHQVINSSRYSGYFVLSSVFKPTISERTI